MMSVSDFVGLDWVCRGHVGVRGCVGCVGGLVNSVRHWSLILFLWFGS